MEERGKGFINKFYNIDKIVSNIVEKGYINMLKRVITSWDREEDVVYEGKMNGIWYLASLRPIRRGAQVVEVIG